MKGIILALLVVIAFLIHWMRNEQIQFREYDLKSRDIYNEQVRTIQELRNEVARLNKELSKKPDPN
jgi:uncharacterized membrane protein YfhO